MNLPMSLVVAAYAERHNIKEMGTCVSKMVVVMPGLLSAVCAWKRRHLRQSPATYSVTNCVDSGLLLPGTRWPTMTSPAVFNMAALKAVGIFAVIASLVISEINRLPFPAPTEAAPFHASADEAYVLSMSYPAFLGGDFFCTSFSLCHNWMVS